MTNDKPKSETSKVDVAAPLAPPTAWAKTLDRYRWDRQAIGCSEASVFRLTARGRPAIFLRTEPAGPFAELPGEVARLDWLAEQGIACPKVLAQTRDSERHWLMMSPVPGHDLASSPDVAPEAAIAIAADALRMLHALDAPTCPFDHQLDQRIELARARMAAGLVDEEDFDEERQGRMAADVFEQLSARRPRREEPVVTHGDACLPNLMAAGGRFTGFIDCGRLGIADRHQDLALASRSIRDGLGEQWIGPFLRRYGGTIDPVRIDFYRLLDEFF